jgi:hypothetical protein
MLPHVLYRTTTGMVIGVVVLVKVLKYEVRLQLAHGILCHVFGCRRVPLQSFLCLYPIPGALNEY